jgi:hypothetical protein
VWNSIADWTSQGEWMLATRVEVVEDRAGVGTKIAAFTGVVPRRGWIGIWDLMEVQKWQPPHRCDVIHYGKWLKGTGYFQLEELGPGQTRFTWSEELTGLLATVIKPGLAVGVWLSLRRFARQIRSNQP